MALITQADLEAVLFRNFDTDPDPLIAAVLDQTQTLIDGIVGRPLESASYDQYVDGTNQSVIWLGRWPVTAVSAVTVDGVAWTVDVDFKWRSDGRLVALEDGLAYNTTWKTPTDGWPLGVQNIRVEYTAGYVTAPPGFVPLAAQIAKRIYEDAASSANSPDGVVQETVGGTSLTYQWQNQAPSSGGLTDELRQQVLAMPWAQRRRFGAIRQMARP